ncbi:MAG: lysine--tRNA ligase, partial [Ilumatobacter sp.]|nr:lysine--tRNA ligase [Ilumatobacter sp.]
MSSDHDLPLPDGGDAATDDTISGSGLVAEKAKRLQKLDTMREAGANPYPYRFDRSLTLHELRARFGDLEPGTETPTEVAVAGRVMLLREQGKLVFATMRDRDGEVQLFVSKAVVGDDLFA